MPKYQEYEYKRAIRTIGLKAKSNYDFKDSAMFECPYHSDKHPSLGVDFRKNTYHCFSCKRSGTISDLVFDMTRMGIGKLLGLGSNLNSLVTQNMKLIQYQKEDIQKQKIEIVETPIDIRGVLIDFDKSEEALQYLKTRYIDISVAKKMKMQYTKEAYINGLHFENRLIIPTYTQSGVLVNLEGRDVTFKSSNKCLYPSGGLKIIYDWYLLDLSKPVYLFEGLIKMAVARSDSYFENSTSSMGAYLSDYQFELLNKIPKIIIVPDNDKAGEILIEEIKKKYKGNIEILRIVDKSIKDADEIPKKSGKSVLQFRESGGFLLESSLH